MRTQGLLRPSPFQNASAVIENQLIVWSGWQPLEGCWRGARVPRLPGLYRIRCTAHDRANDTLSYIGQTGDGRMTLMHRLGMLRGVYGDEMPYRDPHTAAPALWAMRHKDRCDFEVSTSVIEDSTPWRKGVEAIAIALYRQQHGRSPAANFGRMPTGYRMSSSNNARLVASGKRLRGGTAVELDASHAPSLVPSGTLAGDVAADVWCGLRWSQWRALTSALNHFRSHARVAGVYRLRRSGFAQLLYIGQGWVLARLASHCRKTLDARSLQGHVFGTASQLECSWVLNDSWLAHQRLEVENDLIAAHVLRTGLVPPAQFIGSTPLMTVPTEV